MAFVFQHSTFVTGCACPASCWSCPPFAASHTKTALSRPPEKSRPPTLARVCTAAAWPFMTPIPTKVACAASNFHARMVVSALALKRCSPATHMSFTQPVWPTMSRTEPSAIVMHLMVPLTRPAKTYPLSAHSECTSPPICSSPVFSPLAIDHTLTKPSLAPVKSCSPHTTTAIAAWVCPPLREPISCVNVTSGALVPWPVPAPRPRPRPRPRPLPLPKLCLPPLRPPPKFPPVDPLLKP
mmetsp:Transcript_6863/g.28067  ORF Transcript_6863/g.28067 Transcript_6863/m.28067 type:complete len:240 (+) Transcript_6863:456-1175(+)